MQQQQPPQQQQAQYGAYSQPMYGQQPQYQPPQPTQQQQQQAYYNPYAQQSQAPSSAPGAPTQSNPLWGNKWEQYHIKSLLQAEVCKQSGLKFTVSPRSNSGGQGHAGHVCVLTSIVHVGVDVKKLYPEFSCKFCCVAKYKAWQDLLS